MKKLIPLILIIFLVINLRAQDTAAIVKPWKTGALFALTFSQSSLTNWSSGGENAIDLNSYLIWFGNYATEKHIWETRVDLAYGLTKQGSQEFRKNDDKIDISSLYGLKAAEKWFYSAMFTFRTQFSDGFDYLEDTTLLLSGFLAPAYTSFGVGMNYKPANFINIYISPVTARWIIVDNKELSNRGSFGVTPGETVKSEFGAFLHAELAKDVTKTLNLMTKLELFSDYLSNPQNIDVYWDFFATLAINNWLAVTLNTTLIYDDDVNIIDKDLNVGPRTQFREIFGIGLTYNLGAKLEE